MINATAITRPAIASSAMGSKLEHLFLFCSCAILAAGPNGGGAMHTPYDDVIAAIRAGLARCPRRWFRELSVALDPDELGLAERVVAQTIVAELDAACYQVRKLPPSAPDAATATAGPRP